MKWIGSLVCLALCGCELLKLNPETGTSPLGEGASAAGGQFVDALAGGEVYDLTTLVTSVVGALALGGGVAYGAYRRGKAQRGSVDSSDVPN